MAQVTEAEARQNLEQSRETEWRLPSFGKELYLGDFRLDLIHPQPPIEAEKAARGEAFLKELAAFLESDVVDAAQIEADAKIPEPVIDGFKKLGALGMKVPQQYGGLGLSQVHYNQALAMVGTYSGALGALLSAHQSIGVAEPLVIAGSEEQKQKWLPLVAKDHISAFLLTEPDVGSDPARVATQAIPTADGTGYRLTGRKLWATNGVIADIVVVMARIPKGDGHKGGVSAFVLPYDTEGVTVEHRNQFMGLKGIENSVTKLQDAFVPNENLIGKEGEGLKIALKTLNTGRLALPATCVGATKWAVKVAREFGSERVQWGQPVGKHDEVAQKIAYIAATSFGLEAVVDVCARLSDAKRADIRIEAALGKLYASELTWTAIDDLVQIRGGRGFETAASLKARGERPVPTEQALRDQRINRIFEGSTEIMHLQIAREAVDQHLSVAGELITGDGDFAAKAKSAKDATKFYSKWLPQLAVGEGQKPTSYDEFGPLAKHLRFVERNSRKLARQTFYAMGRYQAKLEKKGALLGRIVDIGAELFAIAATCTYAQAQIKEHPERRAEILELADAFCQQARRRAKARFHELWNNDDDQNYDVALGVLDGRYLFLEDRVVDPSGTGPLFQGPETLPNPTPEKAGSPVAAD